MQYSIYEGNMDRLEKKLTRIKNKCAKYGNPFTYEVVGEEFKQVSEKDKRVLRYVIINVEGKAQIADWIYVATLSSIENGNGNVISKNPMFPNEIPERFYNCPLVCEHCGNTNVKSTYIIYNEKENLYKQVGKSCLMDFTRGMDAEYVAAYISLFDELIKGEAPWGSSFVDYIDYKEYLLYVVESVKKCGYKNKEAIRPTSCQAFDFYRLEHGTIFSERVREELKKEMDSLNFEATTESNKNKVEEMLGWLGKQGEDNNYFHNLKTVCHGDYTEQRFFNLIASLAPTYDKAMEKEKEYKISANQERKESQFKGKVGERIKDIRIGASYLLSSWETEYGFTRLYKILDKEGNVYLWKSTGVPLNDEAETISGTVKELKEYDGVKETVLTRCRVITKKREEA